jgi:hypothetical protein
LFVGQSLNPLEFHDRGYLVEQVDRENERLFIVSVLMKHDSGDRSHLTGNPGMPINFYGEAFSAMRVDRPESAGDDHHPGVIHAYGRLVKANPILLAEAFAQIDALRGHGTLLEGLFDSLVAFDTIWRIVRRLSSGKSGQAATRQAKSESICFPVESVFGLPGLC